MTASSSLHTFAPGDLVVREVVRSSPTQAWKRPLRIGEVAEPRDDTLVHADAPWRTESERSYCRRFGKLPVRWPDGQHAHELTETLVRVGPELLGMTHAQRVRAVLGEVAHASLLRSGWPEDVPGSFGDQPPRVVDGPAVARMVRSALAERFPGTRFSVRTRRDGHELPSIRIAWANGPTLGHVQEVTEQFAGATFDGMRDLTVEHPSLLLRPDGTAEYVQFGVRFALCERHLSEDYRQRLRGKVAEITDAPFDPQRHYRFRYLGSEVDGYGEQVLWPVSSLAGDLPAPTRPIRPPAPAPAALPLPAGP